MNTETSALDLDAEAQLRLWDKVVQIATQRFARPKELSPLPFVRGWKTELLVVLLDDVVPHGQIVTPTYAAKTVRARWDEWSDALPGHALKEVASEHVLEHELREGWFKPRRVLTRRSRARTYPVNGKLQPELLRIVERAGEDLGNGPHGELPSQPGFVTDRVIAEDGVMTWSGPMGGDGLVSRRDYTLWDVTGTSTRIGVAGFVAEEVFRQAMKAMSSSGRDGGKR
jgi:hypothetical protein